MNKTEKDMLDKIAKERPHLQLFEDLPTPIQDDVLTKAQTEFATQIADNRKTIIDSITGSFGPKALEGAFGSINPQGKLDSIVGGAGNQFSSKLVPSVGGGLGGFL